MNAQVAASGCGPGAGPGRSGCRTVRSRSYSSLYSASEQARWKARLTMRCTSMRPESTAPKPAPRSGLVRSGAETARRYSGSWAKKKVPRRVPFPGQSRLIAAAGTRQVLLVQTGAVGGATATPDVDARAHVSSERDGRVRRSGPDERRQGHLLAVDVRFDALADRDRDQAVQVGRNGVHVLRSTTRQALAAPAVRSGCRAAGLIHLGNAGAARARRQDHLGHLR